MIDTIIFIGQLGLGLYVCGYLLIYSLIILIALLSLPFRLIAWAWYTNTEVDSEKLNRAVEHSNNGTAVENNFFGQLLWVVVTIAGGLLAVAALLSVE